MSEGQVEFGFLSAARSFERHMSWVGGGGALCIYHRGRKVVDIWTGTQDAQRTPWERGTLAMSFSTTKGVTATLLHVLADRGLLDYDDPMTRYWPEFGAGGKTGITIRQVMSHQAGLYHVRQMIDRADRMLDWQHMVGCLERAQPAFEPGTANAYHGLTFGWLVGELIQRVTGAKFSELVVSELAEPLGLDGLFVGAPQAAKDKAAELRRPGSGRPDAQSGARAAMRSLGPILRLAGRASRALRIPFDPESAADALVPRNTGSFFWHPQILDTPIPAVNGLFSARSLAKLYATLAGGGALDGVRLLSPDTVKRASQIQTRRIDRVLPMRPLWRLGYHRVFTTAGSLPAAFGHFGYGGSGAWADPSRDLAVAFVNNCPGGGPLGDLRLPAIGAAARRCADRLGPS
jgi:CubicO group peptidase (beta-lactamase class C family)